MSEGDYKVIKNCYEKALADSTQELLEITNKMREQRSQIIESNLQSDYADLLNTLNRSIENLEGIISIRSRGGNSIDATRKLSNHLSSNTMPSQKTLTPSICNSSVANDTANKDNYNNESNDNINNNIKDNQNNEYENINNEDTHNDASNVDNPNNENLPNDGNQPQNSNGNESELDNNNSYSRPNLASGDSNENIDNNTQPNQVSDDNNRNGNNSSDAIPPTKGNTSTQRQKRGYPIQMGNFSGILAKLLSPRRSVNDTQRATTNTNKGYTTSTIPKNDKTATFSQFCHKQKVQERANPDSQSNLYQTSHYIHSYIAGNTNPKGQDNKKEPFVGSMLHTNSHKMSSQNLYKSIEPWGYPPFVDMPNLAPQGDQNKLAPDAPCNDIPDNMPDYPSQSWGTSQSNLDSIDCNTPKCPQSPMAPFDPCKPNHGAKPCPPCNDTPCKPYPPQFPFPSHQPQPKPSPCDPKDMILYHECDIISLLLLYMTLRPNNPHSHRICTLAESHFNILRNLITKDNK